MAWITPVTDWVEGDIVNHDDINRIEGNIEILRGSLVQGSFDMTFSDSYFAVAQTATCYYGYLSDVTAVTVVKIDLPYLLALTTASSAFVGAGVPVAIRPTLRSAFAPITTIQNDGAGSTYYVPGMIEITTAGAVKLSVYDAADGYYDDSSWPVNTSWLMGFIAQQITYTLE